MEPNLFLILFLVFLKKHNKKTLNIVNYILRPFPVIFRNKVPSLLSSFIDGFVGLKNWKHYVSSIILSFFIWICFLFVFLFGFLTFNLDLPWISSLVLMIITTFSIIIPSSPGYIGTYHFLCQISLGLFGITKTTALAFAIVTHAVNIFPFFLMGLIFAWKEGINLVKMNKDHSFEQKTQQIKI